MSEPQARSTRIVVFTSDLSFSVRKGIVEIDRAVGGVTWLILVHAPRKEPRRLIRSQWLNLRRNGWRWIPYQTRDILSRVVDRLRQPARGNRCGSQYTTEALTSRPNVRVLRVPDIHSDGSVAQVKEFEPDLGLSIAAPILRRSLFSIPRLRTINLHKGKVPDFRGMPPAFWEMWHDARSVGCTIHFVDAKLDTGDIVAETAVDREEFSTVRGLQLKLDEVGIDLMRTAVEQILTGAALPKPQPAGGKTYRKPTLHQIETLTRKLDRPRRFNPIKNAVAATSFALWRAGAQRALTPRIVVLLYHRVSDAARDNLTVGIEQFDRQMALLAANCDVLSIEEVIAQRTVAKSRRPQVCVTFDDGYLDNYSNAVPILLRHQVPAAFFVATGIVGTDGRFPHDVQRGNPTIPVMEWHQLREMHDLGFTIGSHSVNHIDCASDEEATVRNELSRSRADLQRELGIQDVVFAYPYGGRQHMTAQRLELVKQAGYIGCLSAYGGANIGSVDRFNVLRRPIHWEFSDQAMLFECMGVR